MAPGDSEFDTPALENVNRSLENNDRDRDQISYFKCRIDEICLLI